jgi:hypothetical protein
MSQTAFNVVRTRTNTCATCGSPIRPLDGAMAGSNLPDGWHHGRDGTACALAARTDYNACFDIAWGNLARAKAAFYRYWDATMDEDKTWTRAELDKLLAGVQIALDEGCDWGYYPRHGKRPEPHEDYIHSTPEQRSACRKCSFGNLEKP